MKDEPEEAELILHDALHLAHKSHNTEAITYTYDLVTPLARLSCRQWCRRRAVSVPDWYSRPAGCLSGFCFY